MAPFDRSHTSSYLPSIVTMALSCIVCEILRVIGRKLWNFYTQPVFITPAGGDPIGISWRCLMLIKLEWLGNRTVKMYVNPFSSDTGMLQTDGRMDGQTDRRRELLYQYRTSVCWRAIKMEFNKNIGIKYCQKIWLHVYPILISIVRYKELPTLAQIIKKYRDAIGRSTNNAILTTLQYSTLLENNN